LFVEFSEVLHVEVESQHETDQIQQELVDVEQPQRMQLQLD
jgi:hypothetical protein